MWNIRTEIDTWKLGVVSKQLRLLRGRVGDYITLVNSLSPQMSELVEDAVASCCDDIDGHFGLIRKEPEKSVELKLEFFSFNTSMSQIFWPRVVQPRPKYSYCIFLKGLCWVSVCRVLNNTLCSMSWVFFVFILCLIVPLIFGTICCAIFQIYIIIYNVHGVSKESVI